MIEEHKENLRPRPVAGGAAAPSAPLVPAAMSKSKAFVSLWGKMLDIFAYISLLCATFNYLIFTLHPLADLI